MAASVQPFRFLPDRFARRNHVTLMAPEVEVNDERRHELNKRRRVRQETGSERSSEASFHVEIPAINCQLDPSNSHTVRHFLHDDNYSSVECQLVFPSV
jgi:hypothetical protein